MRRTFTLQMYDLPPGRAYTCPGCGAASMCDLDAPAPICVNCAPFMSIQSKGSIVEAMCRWATKSVLLTSYALNPWLLTGYVLLMTFFNFAHERIWHDSNFGITVETDEVMFRRVWAKTFTYRIVSMMFLTGVFVASLPTIPWTALLLYQGFSGLCYMGLETAWARSTLGITGIPEAA